MNDSQPTPKRKLTFYWRWIDTRIAYTGRFFILDCSDNKKKIFYIGLVFWELRIAYEPVK